MNKRERQRLEKALANGTVPCSVCRREHDPASPKYSRGRCVDRAACAKRVRVPGTLPKFVTLGRLVYFGAGSATQQRMDLQAAAYREHMDRYKFDSEKDLYVA